MNATEKHVLECKETEVGLSLISPACEDITRDDKGDLKRTSLTSKERMDRYKDERRSLLREKYKPENYLNPAELDHI